MNAIAELSYNTRRAICMAVAALIVTAGLGLTAVGIQSMIHDAEQTVAMR
jgi:hypothetical protein